MVGDSKGEWSPPYWMYRDRRPADDDAYFENLTRTIFFAGLSWETIEKKWNGFKKAFKDFSVEEVAKFNEEEVEFLVNDPGIVRNKAKIIATIKNAKEMQSIKKECGSFKDYLESLDKSDNYSRAIKELQSKFSHVGPSTAEIFLWSVGEDIKPHWEGMEAGHHH
jgi:DNA-3-methyladenine glycosylase I